MPRALWKGAISFGLVYVPVELRTASKDNTLPLHMLDSRDFAPVGYHRINKKTGQEVDWSHIVKGYEYKKGDFVALVDADFKHANVKASETIEIDTFCDTSQIPAMYYEKPYYLAPTKGGDKVYALLRQALESTQKVAVATFVMHQRQHLCVADLKRRVQEKIRKHETHSLNIEDPAQTERPKAQVIDLMAALKASLKKSGGRAAQTPHPKSAKRKRA